MLKITGLKQDIKTDIENKYEKSILGDHIKLHEVQR